MRKQYKIFTVKGIVEREYNHIPVRYIVAVLCAILEIAAIIGAVLLLCHYVHAFYVICIAMSVLCIVRIIASDDNPDYKIPWLICVITLPIAGAMLYLMFYSRKLKPRFIKRIRAVQKYKYEQDDSAALGDLLHDDAMAASQAKMLAEISYSHIFTNTATRYFPSGREMRDALINDLESAASFIFLDFFIIEEGVFWGSVLDVLKRKVNEGVDVRVIYDDLGCMFTLPGNYNRILEKHGIKTVIFSKLRGSAGREFNNRSHRKIAVIDGKIGYTGGINIADEYIGERMLFGHWKDTAIRLEGEAVRELTWLFVSSFGINSKELPPFPDGVYPSLSPMPDNGYLIPFGDGPRPIYNYNVAKSAIQNLLGCATDYVYMTTPYLIIDNDLCADIERTALRGVDVRIVTPHVPDKRIVFAMTHHGS